MEKIIKVLAAYLGVDSSDIKYDPDDGYFAPYNEHYEIIEKGTQLYEDELDTYLEQYIDDITFELDDNILDCINWDKFKLKFNLDDFGWDKFTYENTDYFILPY